MTLAASDAARGGAIPRELVIGQSCRKWGCLPRHGGWYDQPARLMLRMTVSVNVYTAMQAFLHSKRWGKFAENEPELWAIVQDVLELERWRKAAGGFTGMMDCFGASQ